jgi:hypothetical protein
MESNMKMRFSVAITVALVLHVGACGDVAGEGEGEGETTFACLRDDVLCDTANGEMCLHERFANGEGHTPTCISAGDCSDCDCAEAKAQAEFAGVNNCDGGVACSISNGAITVICQNVGL